MRAGIKTSFDVCLAELEQKNLFITAGHFGGRYSSLPELSSCVPRICTVQPCWLSGLRHAVYHLIMRRPQGP